MFRASPTSTLAIISRPLAPFLLASFLAILPACERDADSSVDRKLATLTTQAADSILDAPHAQWDRASLPSVIQSRVHLKAESLARFPMDSLLLDPHNWRPTAIINGMPCSLLVETGTDARRIVRSLKDVKPGDWFYCLYYVPASWRGFNDRRGPHYCWTTEGRLTERAWLSSDRVNNVHTLTVHYPTGNVFSFEFAKYRKRPPGTRPRGRGERFEEYFARNGDLIACSYIRQNGSRVSPGAYYWMGRRVAAAEFGDMRLALIRRAYADWPDPRRRERAEK